MKKTTILCTLALLLFSCQTVFGWGQKGHDIITSIADAHLTCKARKNINRLLDGHTIVYYSSWLDNVRNDERYKESKTWHYANVDEGMTYETMKKHPDGDVVAATKWLIETLNRKDINDSVKSVYLKYIIHTVADLHCPMHAGRLSDTGGNKYPVEWFGQQSNLHRVWDSQFIESTRRWSYTEWRQNIDIYHKKQIRQMSAGTVDDWFNETVRIAKQIYDSTPEGSNLSYDYMYYNYYMLEVQLYTAGYRLAAVLNAIFG